MTTIAKGLLPPEELRLTPHRAADVLGCHVSRIYRLIFRGELRAYRVGGRYVLDRRDVEAKVEVVGAQRRRSRGPVTA